ncbi:hypothetical protein SDC9_09175 [bioreactor metagenome]|uniref:Uncharacterized protein n=1 Tax=bioreactor metagenome TaxID=1076179 RepID=A0A644T9A8_9ZZZZ|nr:hypothetical protein [Negativicutes bacterium]
MLATDFLYFLLPFTIGILIFFRSGHKFYSTTAVPLVGLAMFIYFTDIKPFWLTLVAYVVLWAVIFIIPKRMKK